MQRQSHINANNGINSHVKTTLDLFLDSVKDGNVFLFEILLAGLLDKGFDIKQIVDDKFGANALHFAANKGKLEIAEILLNMFPELVNTKSANGSTAILDACIYDHYDVVLLLVSRGAIPGMRNLLNYNVFSYIEKGMVNKRITKYIIEYQETLDQLFIKAIFENNVDGIKLAHQKGANINVVFKQGSAKASCTALFHACVSGNTTLVRQLLLYNPDLEMAAENGMTPLHGALFYGYEEIVRLLVENGATIDAKANSLAESKPWLRSSLSKRLPITVIIPDTASNSSSNSANPAVLFSANNNNSNVTNIKTVSLSILCENITSFNKNFLSFSSSFRSCIDAFNIKCEKNNMPNMKITINLDTIIERIKLQIKTLVECLSLDSIVEIKDVMKKDSQLIIICCELKNTLTNLSLSFHALELGSVEYLRDYHIALDAHNNMQQSITFLEKKLKQIKANKVDLIKESNVTELKHGH